MNYRGHVGPAKNYALIGAHQFCVLHEHGLKETDKVLDYGCGSLRLGKLLIPWLEPGNYTGFEPEFEVTEAAIEGEKLSGLVEDRSPTLISRLEDVPEGFDVVVAHSIFTHTGLGMMNGALMDLFARLKSGGSLLGTFLTAQRDDQRTGWVYPDCTHYQPRTFTGAVTGAGFDFHPLEAKHPHKHRWFRASKP